MKIPRMRQIVLPRVRDVAAVAAAATVGVVVVPLALGCRGAAPDDRPRAPDPATVGGAPASASPVVWGQELGLASQAAVRARLARRFADIAVLGRGEFDHEGWDDLLVRSNRGVRGGSIAGTGLFVLTRSAPNHPLRVVRRLW